MPGVRNMVSSSQAVFIALEEMGMESFSQNPILTYWATLAEQKIDVKYNYQECIEVLDSVDCCVTLPSGTRWVDALLIGDHGTDCGLVFDQMTNLLTDVKFEALDQAATRVVGIDDLKEFTFGYEIQNGKLIFNQSLDGDKVTVKLRKFHTDSNGFVMVEDNHIDAIAAFIKKKVADRSRFGKNKMTRGDMQDLQQEWNFLCKQARAESSKPTASEESAASYMLNNPFSGKGIRIPARFIDNYQFLQ